MIVALVLLPLIGFLINFLLGSKLPKALVGLIGCGTILAGFIISVTYFFNILGGTGPLEIKLFDWINVDSATLPFNISFSFLVDRLSVLMLLIITGVGFLIHVYSVGYMHDDEGYHRFFSYLNLFIFFMQMLVLGANYLILFIGWEGVGLCSYLLIGFWYKNQAYNDAAKKAFIMNRIGDLGFLLGVFWIFETFGSIQYTEVFKQAQGFLVAHNYNDTSIVFITILLFIGACGKSAQLPLYTWLPDAMAGPTPVSALIHAATMVTAGIYLIVRSHILFVLSPYTLEIIAVVGMATAIFAGTIGLKQNDIKKVLAYSTVSQLGFMFVALGVGSFTTAMFHLLTHAFFKALLFLAAGSVIHAMGGEQDIRRMGGLSKKLPITYMVFLIGTLAITGIPPFAGFFSKDEILAEAFNHSPVLWVFGVIASIITAIYMFRLLFMTFSGNFRGTHHEEEHLHESPPSMTIPLMILAGLSVVGGFLGMPEGFGVDHKLKTYLAPIFSDLRAYTAEHTEHAMSHQMEYGLMAFMVAITLGILFWARMAFTKKEAISMDESQESGIGKVLANKYYVDEIYDAIIIKPLHWCSAQIYRFVEVDFIDGIVNGTGRLAFWKGGFIRRIQTGNTGTYIFMMVLGIVLMILLNTIIPLIK